MQDYKPIQKLKHHLIEAALNQKVQKADHELCMQHLALVSQSFQFMKYQERSPLAYSNLAEKLEKFQKQQRERATRSQYFYLEELLSPFYQFQKNQSQN